MSTASTDSGDRPGTAVRLEGSLAKTPLAEILRRVTVEERSGDLEVTGTSFKKTVYFDRGFVVFASSNRKTDRLGESMIEAGRISRHEFALASMLMKSTKRKFGEVLVEAGIVPQEELGRFVAAQVNRIVLSLFLAKEASYRFVERPCTIPVELMVSLSVYRILIEGVRRMSRKSLVLAGLPPLTTELKLVDQPPFTLDVDKLRPEEKAVLRAANNGATLRDIVTIVDGHEGVTLRACYALLCGGVLEPVEVDPRKRLLQVQEETGTFVLSEIRHKVEPVAAPIAPVPTTRSDAVEPPPTTPPRSPIASPADPPAEVESTGLTLGDLFDRLGQVWNTVLGWLGREATPSPVKPMPAPRRAPPTPRAFDRPAKPTPPVQPKAPADGPRTDERVGVPEWSHKDDPEGATEPSASMESPKPSAPTESLGAPAWSLKADDVDDDVDDGVDDGPIVPSWSMVDPVVDPGDDTAAPVEAASETPGEVAHDPEPRSERMEPPAWSIADVPEPPEDVVLDTSQVLEVESDLQEESLPDLDTELFVEEDASGDGDLSMLRQIPVENVELSQDLEVELDLEADVESEVQKVQEELAPELEQAPEPERAATPAPPPPRPLVSATPPPEPARTPAARADNDAPIQESDARDSTHEQEMRRMKQSGGEQRLLRDVKLHFRMRDWQGAVPLLEQLIAISPGKALYRGMLARAMSRDPVRRKDAEEHFIEALRMSPRDPELHYWLGLYYKSFGLSSRAITEFRTTLRINPKHEGARKQLGGGKKDDALGNVFKKLFG